MEVDHIFICTQSGAPEAESLNEYGLSEGTPNSHPGQGTANRRFFFHNAMIELLWVEDILEIQSERTKPTKLWERCSVRSQQISPFGICFRPQRIEERNAPFPAWKYQPSYLPGPLGIEIGEGSPLSEPMWFFLPFGTRPDSYKNEQKQPLLHKVGLKEITSVHVSVPPSDKLSSPAKAAIQSRWISIGQETSNLMELEFDNAKQGKEHDFRPILPLLFRW